MRGRRGAKCSADTQTPAAADRPASGNLATSAQTVREARYLLAEEPDLHDMALYHSVLAAIANGNANRGGIADYLGRKSTDLAHPLSVLQDVGMITHEEDAFRKNRSSYRIAEPLISFYHAVMRPVWGDLERPGRADRVWQRVRPTFQSKVLGPHFEHLCREWTRWRANPDTIGGVVARVAAGTVSDPGTRTAREIDAAAFGRDDDGREVLLAIGEVKWNDPMGMGHLRRLEEIRELVQGRELARAAKIRLICYSGAGFMPELHHRAESDATVQLVDLPRLYHGD